MFKPNTSKIIAAIVSIIFLILLIYSFGYWNYLQMVKYYNSCTGFGCGAPGTIPHLPQITFQEGEYSLLGGILVYMGLSFYQKLVPSNKKTITKRH
jgi:hypothetical protein